MKFEAKHDQTEVPASDNFGVQILWQSRSRRAIAKRNRTIAELCEQGFNPAEIAKYIRLTRQRVWQILRAANLKPKPRKVTASCESCQKPFTKFRSLIVKSKRHFCSRACAVRSRKPVLLVSCHACGSQCRQSRFGKRSFCSQKCYHSIRQDGKYVPWRQGQRKARKAVSAHFELKPGNVVHHHDDDNRNNDISNLAVFRDQADHMAYHHGLTPVAPLWDGRQVPK